MMPPSQYNYSFFHIAKDSTITLLVERYKTLRLQALSIAPTSFSSSYQIESELSNTEWITRLTADGKETFVCAATPIQSYQSPELGDTIWVAQLTLRGPQTREEFTLPVDSGQKIPREDEQEELWQMLSLFTLPDHRGQGLGKSLCQEALNYLKSYRDHPRMICVRLMVKPENYITVALYRQLGFIEAGKCTLAEALIANGDADLLPKDISGEKYTARTGLIMISEISRW